ncbi:MAG: nucleotidyltransferase domain-containing protein [Ferruginibacter sp.]|nr:nucleotidyltransferase domain-containing protein [Ferruginibacter sp.]
MIKIINNKKAELDLICNNHHVKSLYVFGSALNDNFNTNSDIDFLYKIDTENFEGWANGNFDYLDNLLSLERNLTSVFNKKIDLVPDTIISNKYLRDKINSTKQLLYGN